MNRKRSFEPGTLVTCVSGQTGLVISPETYASVRRKMKEGKRPGRFFSPGCCQRPDYLTQVPVVFDDGTYDIMRSVYLRRFQGDLSREKRRFLEDLVRTRLDPKDEGLQQEE